MSQEILYSSDAKRLLQELETITSSSTNLPVVKTSEHDEALHELFGQVVGLPKEAEAPVKPKSPRMTNNELKAMKVATNKVESKRGGSKIQVLQAIARFFAQIEDVFKARKSKGAAACQQKRA